MKWLDVRAGEGPAVLKATLVLFGLVSAHTMMETARDALFLERLAASRLPLVYALLAGLGLVAARGNAWFVARFGKRNTLIASLLAAAYGTVVLYRLPVSRAQVFALYAWSALLGTLMVAQFWMLCGSIFTLGQSKRLFAPISSGGVLGAVAGASAAVALLRHRPVPQLLLVSAAIFLATAFLLTSLRNDDAAAPVAEAKAPEDEGGEPERQGLFAEMGRWPYLSRIVGLIAISTAAVLGADYLFKSTVARSLPAAQLGSFFATSYMAMNVAALVVQLLLAQYLVRRLGILAAYCVLPVLLVAGGGATLLFGGAVLAAVLTKGADGALRHSLHRISTELLWLPLPEEVRARVKTLVDTVVVRGVQALFAGVLLALAMLELDRPVVIAGLIVALSLAWLGLAVALRRPYLDLFRSALQRRGGAGRGELRLDLGSVEVVVEALSSPDPQRVIAAIDLLVTGNRSRLIPALILYHEAPEVLVRALDAVATPARKDWIPLAERLLGHADEAVRVAVVRALSRVGALDEAKLGERSPAMRGHAAFWQAERAAGAPEDHPSVRQVLELVEPDGTVARQALLSAMSSHGHAGWVEVLGALARQSDAQPPREVSAGVVGAVRKVGGRRFLPMLIDRLRVRHGRDLVRDAIAAMGDSVLDELAAALQNPATDRLVRRHLPRTISRFRTQRAAEILLSTIEGDGDGYVRYKALRGLGRLVAEAPVRIERRRVELLVERNLVEHLRLTAISVALAPGLAQAPAVAQPAGEVLAGLLEDKRSQSLERAFRLLQIAHRREDVHSSAIAVTSGDRQLRAQALEYLDALTLTSEVREIRELFRLVADELSDAERVARGRQFLERLAGEGGEAGEAPADFESALAQLLEDKDDSVVGIAAHFALKHGLEELRMPASAAGPVTLGDAAKVARKVPALEALVRRLEAAGGLPGVS